MTTSFQKSIKVVKVLIKSLSIKSWEISYANSSLILSLSHSLSPLGLMHVAKNENALNC